jgi:hypothetical protein
LGEFKLNLPDYFSGWKGGEINGSSKKESSSKEASSKEDSNKEDRKEKISKGIWEPWAGDRILQPFFLFAVCLYIKLHFHENFKLIL